MLERTTADWVERIEAVGVPCGPINNYAEVFHDPQVQHRKLRVDVARGDGGTAPTIASPLRLAATPVQYRQAPPILGEHTEKVLGEMLGKSPEEIAALRQKRII
jgi:crotonobetainyl-CoA:carnitine CoA-transferase CaiB-like acyl-CoA transferase